MGKPPSRSSSLTDINNREEVFRQPREVQRLRKVLHEVRKIYEFEVCGLRVGG
jgi:REP element-mobilizing transposase RayT